MVLDLSEPCELTGEGLVGTMNGDNSSGEKSGSNGDNSEESGERMGTGDKDFDREDSQDEGCGLPPAEQAEKIADRLALGSTVESLDQAYVLYYEYARLVGFSVKKGTQGYFWKTADIRMKMFHCSSEGHPDNKTELNSLVNYKKQVTHTNCKARLRVTCERDGPWSMSVFHEEHNHELLGEDVSYLLRYARNMTHTKKSILESLNAASIGVSKSCRWLEKEAGGPSNVGFTRKDAYDHMSAIKRVTRVGNTDAEEILQYFTAKSNAEPYFFWKVQTDDDGRIMNFFFRDCRCGDDYESLGMW